MHPNKKAEFITLFQAFATSFVLSLEGQTHTTFYHQYRQTGRQNFQDVLAAYQHGEDITDLVLLKLLPYNDSPNNHAKGAWIHHAPAITGDLKKWYEADGSVYDWQTIASAIFEFIQWCNNKPDELEQACQHFSELSCSKRFQAGMLTPVLNALRPEQFLLINSKSQKTISYLNDHKYSSKLNQYPQTNRAGHALIQELAPEMHTLWDSPLSDADQFDMFCHWLVSIKKFAFTEMRYWKIAPGDNAWHWEECRDQNFIAVGWDQLGDLSQLNRAEFEARRDQLMTQHPEWKWKKDGVNQVWTFSQINEGDRIVANRGTTQVLGIGTVTGSYYFEPDATRHKHRLQVQWDDLTPRTVNEGGWRRTLVALSQEQFNEIFGEIDNAIQGDSVETNSNCPFTSATFELLAALHACPKKSVYLERKSEFRQHLEEPFQKLFRQIASRLPATIKEKMETDRKLFARIPKNDFNHGGAWDFYWGAFYLKGGKRIEDAQLFMWMNHERLEVGFFIGLYGSKQRQQFLNNCRKNYTTLLSLLEESLSDEKLWFGSRGNSTNIPWQEWLQDPGKTDIQVSFNLPKQEVLKYSTDQLADEITQVYAQLFPLILIAIHEDPLPALAEYLNPDLPDDGELIPSNEAYSLVQCAEETNLDTTLLQNWIQAIDRKKQAVLYGPPGTGKTFVAQKLAKHLISEGDGFIDVVQFHPAYTYEDFIQGIRPKRVEGGLDYPIVPGRFLEFCKQAGKCRSLCVLIIDEINRANLSQVFGELMYLMEYRDATIHLASGETFSIPSNVHIIGTMNTADRSIALVDHALRRRFAFLYLPPNYEGLRKFHQSTGYSVDQLISQLTQINAQIGDRHYEIGTSFFLHPDLETQLQSIWQLEIEPYLEEFFFDQPDKVKRFQWEVIKSQLLP